MKSVRSSTGARRAPVGKPSIGKPSTMSPTSGRGAKPVNTVSRSGGGRKSIRSAFIDVTSKAANVGKKATFGATTSMKTPSGVSRPAVGKKATAKVSSVVRPAAAPARPVNRLSSSVRSVASMGRSSNLGPGGIMSGASQAKVLPFAIGRSQRGK